MTHSHESRDASHDAPPSAEDEPETTDSPVATSDATGDGDGGPVRSLRTRSAEFWGRHRTLFWMFHSVWALATGIAVVLLARERYSFVPWVVVFLGLTWASTLFFGKNARSEWEEDAAERDGKESGRAANPTSASSSHTTGASPTLGQEVTSYVTRSLYQETLFFLLPFYAYSTLLRSPNVIFVGLLGGLAILSCLDLLFDRWLRTKVVFGLVFFSTVAFAAVNLILPMLVGLTPQLATPLAATLAVGSAVPLAFRGAHRSTAARIRLGIAAAAIFVVALGVPGVIPPVPLRMTSATFATDIDRSTLALADTISAPVPMSELGDRLVVLVEVFAPTSLPATVRLEWRRDGATVRTTRDVEIVAHEASFRVWDALSPNGTPVEPGRYEVILRTAAGRWFGRAEVEVTGPSGLETS